jgi:hypothetical protein
MIFLSEIIVFKVVKSNKMAEYKSDPMDKTTKIALVVIVIQLLQGRR